MCFSEECIMCELLGNAILLWLEAAGGNGCTGTQCSLVLQCVLGTKKKEKWLCKTPYGTKTPTDTHSLVPVARERRFYFLKISSLVLLLSLCCLLKLFFVSFIFVICYLSLCLIHNITNIEHVLTLCDIRSL